MGFFTKKATHQENNALPQEILGAVSTMDDRRIPMKAPVLNSKSTASESRSPVSPSPSPSASPFLSDVPPAVASGVLSKELPKKVVAQPSFIPTYPQRGVPFHPPASQGLEPLHFRSEGSSSFKKWFYIGVVILFLILVGGGGVWYFMRSAPIVSEVTPEIPAVPMISPTETPVVLEPPFSLEKPNYLSVDTETVTAESLAMLLKQSADRMAAAKMILPVEFLVTDKNNNPIAFSRFAYLIKLEVPSDLLATLEEPFSLFLFNENGRVSLGLSLSFRDEAVGGDLIRKKEASLPLFFRTLFFNGVTLPKQIVFRSSTYNTLPIRFVNIDVSRSLSLDYTFREKEWLLGASKETLRAIINKKP